MNKYNKKKHSDEKYAAFGAKWYDRKGHDPRVGTQRAQDLKDMGYFAGVDLWYDFKKYGYDDFARDRDFYHMHPINGWLTKLIDDKRFIPILFQNKPKLVPQLSISIEDNKVRYVLENGLAEKCSDNIHETVSAYLEVYNELFAKPAGLSGGRGSFKIKKANVDIAVNQFDKEHAYLINNSLLNEAYCSKISPNNISTIRAYFFRGDKNELKFLKIVQRFGTNQSGFVDNLSAGGLACAIDIESGEFSQAFAPMQTIIRHDFHPDTQVKLTGFKVPDWPEKLKVLSEMLENLYFLDFGALDVAVTNNGLKLLEINSLPSRRLIQFDKPAFHNEEFKRFCISKGYGSFDK